MTFLSPAGTLLVLAMATAAPQFAMAQDAKAAAPGPQYPARGADVASVDSIMAALYDVISGPAGKQRDWARLHSLFTPEARMSALGPRKDGSVA